MWFALFLVLVLENFNQRYRVYGFLTSWFGSVSGDKKRDRKKKKVRFAENVEEEKMVERVTESSSKRVERSCRNQIPENQAALYSGILRDRVQRMACSY